MSKPSSKSGMIPILLPSNVVVPSAPPKLLKAVFTWFGNPMADSLHVHTVDLILGAFFFAMHGCESVCTPQPVTQEKGPFITANKSSQPLNPDIWLLRTMMPMQSPEPSHTGDKPWNPITSHSIIQPWQTTMDNGNKLKYSTEFNPTPTAYSLLNH